MKTSTLALMLAGAAVVAGCNSSGSSSDDADEIGGILIAPEQSADADANLLERARFLARSDDSCGGTVPSGYERITNTDISFLDSGGSQVGEDISSDDCGIFRTENRPDASRLVAEPEGRRPISTDVNMFRRSSGDSDDDMAIVSTISEDAEYEIRSLFRQSDGRLGFTVSDTETGRPVIGLPRDAFTLTHESTDVRLANVTSARQSRENASIMLVLDASGSMKPPISGIVFEDDDGNDYTRYHVAHEASHLFLNEKSSGDEAAVMIFDNEVDIVNDNLLEGMDLRDSSDEETEYTFSESGFTSQEEALRFAVDLYLPYSSLYHSPFTNGTDYQPEPHPATPDISIASSYNWDGATALFGAVDQAVDAVAARSNSRKAVVTMGDGENNRAPHSSQIPIDNASSKGIPVYSIALGVTEGSGGYNDLKALAEETGGDFVHVEDDGAETELLNAFESIQIGLVYQYLATLADNDAIQAGDQVVLKLEYNDLEAERAFTVPTIDSNGDDDDDD